MSRLRLPSQWTRTLRHDAQAGVVLGVQSVPDGLATGLLAGLSPLNGLYGYKVGTLAGAAVTSPAFMVVQGTGAMAMVIADVPGLRSESGRAWRHRCRCRIAGVGQGRRRRSPRRSAWESCLGIGDADGGAW